MIDIVFKIVDISLQISEKSRRDLYPLIWFRRNQGGVIRSTIYGHLEIAKRFQGLSPGNSTNSSGHDVS